MRDIVTRRVAVLGAPARRILVLAAAEGECRVDVLAMACAGTASDIAALDEAEVRGLVSIRDGQVGFTHPLIRSALWQSAATGERRAAHRALAAVSVGEARSWHLAAATVGTDEQGGGRAGADRGRQCRAAWLCLRCAGPGAGSGAVAGR